MFQVIIKSVIALFFHYTLMKRSETLGILLIIDNKMSLLYTRKPF